ncbi:DNA repair protein complementing XP-C cells homolog [Coccinella septempunctata]|uniref:DNA repair protein complementing XP-C cells homolog n=1 Tax=Coccinella septempunctata TaxID=41139 RepID=UPI001D069D90|nr:DNA repair protein complementing XP-C cells homolog [Coccinella septempunctata]
MQRRSTRSMKKSSSPVKELESSKPVRTSRAASKRSTLCNADSESSDDDQEIVQKNCKKVTKKQGRKITDSSSSESDIENYLKHVSEIDLDSSFFKSNESKGDVPSFDKIEKEIFSNIKVSRLSDSDSSNDEQTESINIDKKIIPEISINIESAEKDKETIQSLEEGEEIARLNFQRLQDYTKKIEEAKRSVEQYQAKQLQETEGKGEKCEDEINIEDLLAIGEAKKSIDKAKVGKSVVKYSKDPYKDPYDSELENWEEIEEGETNREESLIPQKELEITVEMPSNLKKKKGNDLLAAVKRRLNRIRKENQILIHKVHLLCWIAHGNFVNNLLSDQSMLALGLSLMPSEKSFPSKRVDLDYLEQILKWYKKTVKLAEKKVPENLSLEELLIEQIDKKEAYTKSMLAMIFIVILRSLGIQCRLVISLQVEPLRPPNSDLHFLGNSSTSKDNKSEKTKVKCGETTKSSTSDESTEKEGEKSTKKNYLEKGETTRNSSEVSKKGSSEKKNNTVTKEKIDKSRKSIHSSKEKDSASEKKNIEKERKGRDQTGHSDKKDDEVNSRKIEKKDTSNAKKDPKQLDSQKSERSSRRSQKKDESSGTVEKNAGQNLNKTKLKESNKELKATKDEDPKPKRATRLKSKSPSNESQSVRSKSANVLKVRLERIDEVHGKLRSKSSSSNTGSAKSKKIPQLDGLDDSGDFKGFKGSPDKTKTTNGKTFEQFYTQIYKQVSQKPSSSKVNLKKLKTSTSSPDDEDCKSRKHRRSVKKLSYAEKTSTDSEDDFENSSPKKKRISERAEPKKADREESAKKDKVNLQKLRRSKTTSVENIEKKSAKKTIDVKQDIMNLVKGRIQEQKHIDRSKMVKKRKPAHDSDSEDSDYVPEPIKKKYADSDDEFYPKMKVKRSAQVKEEVKKIKKKKPKDSNSRKVISSDSEYTEEELVVKKEEPVKKKRGCDTWLEVFLEMEEKWISVDVVFGQAHCVNELYSRATHPVSYVLAWNNNNHIKDITRRYCQNFNTATRKLRIDAKWWEESLKPFLGPKNAKDREEDDELDRQQQEKPLPTTISEYKNHPLYALERHLLKFEALYPPNAAPLGYVRNEPVYSRDCVFVCHSRDIWLKQAKVVKRKEQPYKIVKARPKYDKLSNTMITGQNLEIFGPWQVEDYDPPTAENGIVPRNAFGNVDLFKPSMLPKKCVHLRLPGLNKTARRLNIDCASAIVGFDFHGGWSHPVYDGFIVCEEYEDKLVAAWNMEQEEQEKKDQEKYEKRVYGNWKKLIRGLMIRERLKAKYGFGQNKEEEEESEGSSEPQEKKAKVAPKKNRRLISDSSEGEENDGK